MQLDLYRLKAERVAKGLTQDKMAHLLGMKSRSAYAKRECGIVPIGADELGKIACILGYDKNQLGIFFKQNVHQKER